ncbi:hypothetical protein QR680_010933 [Steinernema hermaphroditum]|uniref:Uncharacterized protein n=1 Tax=Steinernema hermaphroditum TaxID=289476 RepID=A0AA39MBH0_9BILA|nr:hypothetical protein QR680_010933 [Steinernema hermaphroditum]
MHVYNCHTPYHTSHSSRHYSYSSTVNSSIYARSKRSDYVNAPYGNLSYMSDTELSSRYYTDNEDDEDCELMMDVSLDDKIKSAYTSTCSKSGDARQEANVRLRKVSASTIIERFPVKSTTSLSTLCSHRSSTYSSDHLYENVPRRNRVVKGELDHTYVNIKWETEKKVSRIGKKQVMSTGKEKDKRLSRIMKKMKATPVGHVVTSIRKKLF